MAAPRHQKTTRICYILFLAIIAGASCNTSKHQRHKRQSNGFSSGFGAPPPPRRTVFFPTDEVEEVEEERCVTPLNRAGSCVPVTRCAPLRRVRDFEFLRRSICGYQNVEPKVCCPRPDRDTFGTSPNPTTGFRPPSRPTTIFITVGTRPPQTPPPRRNTGGTTAPPPTRPPTAKPPQTTPSPTARPQTSTPLVSSSSSPIQSGGGNAISSRKPPNLPKDCGRSNVTSIRIVGGQEAKMGAWPWMTALIIEKNGLKSVSCGGALVTDRHVITAAHCVVSRGSPVPPSRITARLGDHNIHRTDEGAKHVDIPVQKITRHPQFEIATFKNDIAILTLSDPVQFNANITPVCLPYDNLRNEDLANRNPFITGWGSTSFNGPSSSVLREAQIRIWEQKPCEEAFKNDLRITDVYMCAGLNDGSKDACQGDSGGPLVLPAKDESRITRHYLVGITSFGKRCGTPGFPGVYTRVTKFLDWITENMV